MVEISGFQDLVRRWVAPVFGVASLLLVVGTAEGTVPSDCSDADPEDELTRDDE